MLIAPDFVANSTGTRQKAYISFNERHGANAQAILLKFRSLQQVLAGQDHTIAQRRNEFIKTEKKLVEMVR